MSIELLESRIAPAVIVLNAHTATYLDVDGDHVTIKVSSGDLHNAIFTTAPAGTLGGEQLQLLNLVSGFDGANLTVKVAKAKTGDGVADVGAILATGENLGKVAISGDLGQIDAGTNGPLVPAIKSLNALSMGTFGLATQGGVGDLSSDINGALGSLRVTHNVEGATINVFGGANAKLGSVFIGGSLIGGTGDSASGSLLSSGKMGPVRIGKDLVGGPGFTSGAIESGGNLASVTIGGSMLGGSGFPFAGLSGSISSGGDMGMVKIGQNVTPGPRDQTGSIFSHGKLAGVRIGGSFTGGPLGDAMGQIFSALAMGSIEIGHDINGGDIISNSTIFSVKVGGSLTGNIGMESGIIRSASDLGTVKIGGDLQGGDGLASGRIDSGGKITRITVGGSVSGGTGGFSGFIRAETIGDIKIGHNLQSGSGFNSGSIRANENIGSLAVAGSILGNSTLAGNSPVIISAVGQANPTAKTDQAIGAIKIGGQVENALILGGYDTNVNAADTRTSFVNKNAQIGSVKVGGDWIASSLVAGAIDINNDGFSNADDSSGASPVISRIASVIISGKVVGTTQGGDHFGFESSQIGSFRNLGFVAPLTAAPGQVFELSPITADVTVREVLPV